MKVLKEAVGPKADFSPQVQRVSSFKTIVINNRDVYLEELEPYHVCGTDECRESSGEPHMFRGLGNSGKPILVIKDRDGEVSEVSHQHDDGSITSVVRIKARSNAYATIPTHAFGVAKDQGLMMSTDTSERGGPALESVPTDEKENNEWILEEFCSYNDVMELAAAFDHRLREQVPAVAQMV